MSDILIKGMELPKGNDYLHLIIQNGKVHTAISCGHLTTDELNVAEAVELPEHGELVSRKDILTYFENDYRMGAPMDYEDAIAVVSDKEAIPTILESSEVKE